MERFLFYTNFRILSIKTEFAFNRRFDSFEELERELFDYVNWYNNIRIHGSLESVKISV